MQSWLRRMQAMQHVHFTAHGPAITITEDGAMATHANNRYSYCGAPDLPPENGWTQFPYSSLAMCGGVPMSEGRHFLEMTLVGGRPLIGECGHRCLASVHSTPPSAPHATYLSNR